MNSSDARRRLRDSQAKAIGASTLESALQQEAEALANRGWSKQRINTRLMKIRVANIISNNRYPNRNNLLDLARNISGKHSQLPSRVDKSGQFGMHKKRPLYRRINGSEWRLAGTANHLNTYAEQAAISSELATRLRQVGAKARVVKWKNQVGVYYQEKPDPLATVFRQSDLIKTNLPTRFQHEPAIYGSNFERRRENLRRREETKKISAMHRFRMGTDGFRRRNVGEMRKRFGIDAGFNPKDEKWMSGYCHEYAIMLQRKNPKLKLKFARGWEQDAEDDDDFFVEHVWVVDEQGRATDASGTYESEEELAMLWGGANFMQNSDVYQVDELDEDWIKEMIEQGELKEFCTLPRYNRKLTKKDEELLAEGFRPLDLPITKDSGAFVESRRPAEGEVRKLLVIWDGSSRVDGTGVAMGWVTRAEAADLLQSYGQYPMFSDFDKAYKEELQADQFDYGGFQKAEKIAKRREELDNVQKEGRARSEIQNYGIDDDVSWQFISEERANLWPIIQQGFFKPPVGYADEVGYDDLHNAFWDYLVEDGLSEAEIVEMAEDIAWGELDDWFEISDMGFDTQQNDEGEKVREKAIEMNRIDGWRDGRFISEYNDIVPIKSKIRLKNPDEIDLSKPGVEEVGKKILWNMEFGNSDES